MSYMFPFTSLVASLKVDFLKVLSIICLFISPYSAFSNTYTVTNNADAGINTLRQAILDANGNAGVDFITFNFGSPVTITLTTCLPQITSPLTIDGYSDPGASAGNLMIEVISPAGCNGFDFAVGSNGSTIMGLVISGGTNGINLNNSNSHVVKGNYIGTNRAGTAVAVSRPQNCIQLTAGVNCFIGGIGGQLERNILSGATQDGIRCANNSTGMVVINNYIGTDVTGNIALGNGAHGIEGYGTSHNPRVGGSTLAESNVISANTGNGVYFTTCQSPIVKGNILGMGLNGSTMLPNGSSGIDIQNTGTSATMAIIGGPLLAERNYASCNGAFGVVVRYAPGSIIQNNWLGVDKATGNLDYGNRDAGITVTNTADVQCLNNICSGNGVVALYTGADGISIFQTSPRPIIKGNIIGLGADGTTCLPNIGHGIECLTCDDGVIGGLLVSERNVIACSFNRGIQCVNSPRVTIENNYIGTDVTGILNRGGTETGISVGGTSNDVIIGGSVAGGNIIAYNNQNTGVVIESTSQRNEITYNSIFCNTGNGIDIAGATANEGVLPPGIGVSGSMSISGTGVTGNIIHVYRNATADGGVKCNCEGEIYIGTTTVVGGAWTVTHNLGLSVAEAASVTSTQTTPNGSTSEFTACATPLPVQLIRFSVEKNFEGGVLLSWATSSEKSNKLFEVLRSSDGIHFNVIGSVNGNGNSFQINEYTFIDANPIATSNYYQLRQIDNNNQYALSEIKNIVLFKDAINLIGNQDGFTIVKSGGASVLANYSIYSLTGGLVTTAQIKLGEGFVQQKITLPLSNALYIVSVVAEGVVVNKKILIEAF